MRSITTLILMLAALAQPGCQIFAWTVAQFGKPPKVKPVYEIPKDKKILVFVDSDVPLNFEPIKCNLTEELNSQFIGNKIAGSVVSYVKLMDVLESTKKRLSVSEVGKKLDADYVLYVRIEKFSVKDEEATTLWQGKLQVAVRLVDVQKGKVWPTDQKEYVLPLIELSPVDESSPGYGADIARQLSQQMADEVAKLFYEHAGQTSPPPSQS